MPEQKGSSRFRQVHQKVKESHGRNYLILNIKLETKKFELL